MMAGGGTGGHVYPGVALARELEDAADASICWVGTEGRVESFAVPRAGYPIEYLRVEFLKGRRGLALLGALAGMPRALWQALRLVGRVRPDAVVGLGGFVSGPVCLAAALRGVPVFLLEQNATPGLTTRLNARVARRVFATFPESREHLPAQKVEVMGNPIRRELLVEAARAKARRLEAADAEPGSSAAGAAGMANGAPDDDAVVRVLVVGGSQGSLTLNEHAPRVLRELARRGVALRVRHASGRGRTAEVAPRYEGAPFPVQVDEYIDDMAAAYADADLLICRAGATTISELTALGLPALYVPFPFAADDHQTANARSVVDAGGGWMCTDAELATDKPVALLEEVLGDRSRLEAASQAARTLGRPHAAAGIAERIRDLLGDR